MFTHGVSCVCVFYVSLESSVTPNVCVCVLMGSAVLYICRSSLVLYSVRSTAMVRARGLI